MSEKRKGSNRTSRKDDEVPELDVEWIRGADFYEGEKLVRRGRPSSRSLVPCCRCGFRRT